MNEIEREGDVAEILDKSGFEEGFHKGNAWDGGHEEGGSDEEEEPFRVCNTGGIEVGEEVPAWLLS